MDTEKLSRNIEALLFVHGEPMTLAKLAKIIDASEDEIVAGIGTLRERYRTVGSGLTIIVKGKEIEIATSAEHASSIEKLLTTDREETLGKAALEVLSIIAYRGPVSRAAIETIRGVNCTFSLRNLLLRGLIERRPNPTDNREYEYSVSFQAIEALGLQAVTDLPDYQALSSDARLTLLDAGQGPLVNPVEIDKKNE